MSDRREKRRRNSGECVGNRVSFHLAHGISSEAHLPRFEHCSCVLGFADIYNYENSVALGRLSVERLPETTGADITLSSNNFFLGPCTFLLLVDSKIFQPKLNLTVRELIFLHKVSRVCFLVDFSDMWQKFHFWGNILKKITSTLYQFLIIYKNSLIKKLFEKFRFQLLITNLTSNLLVSIIFSVRIIVTWNFLPRNNIKRIPTEQPKSCYNFSQITITYMCT